MVFVKRTTSFSGRQARPPNACSEFDIDHRGRQQLSTTAVAKRLVRYHWPRATNFGNG